MRQWNDEKLKKRYDRIKERAIDSPNMKAFGYDESFFNTPTLEGWKFPTHSAKQRAKIELAYTLGRMRAIKDIDEGSNLIVPSQPAGASSTDALWIPVSSERLPEDCEDVQVTFVGYNDGKRYSGREAYIFNKRWFWLEDHSPADLKIVAWLPNAIIPEPYTGE